MDRSGFADERRMVERSRLVERLAERFESRLTIITGGGGAGKSTLLRQARSTEPDRIDVVHTVSPHDRDPEELVVALGRALAEALGQPESDDGGVDTIADRILAASPKHVCLIIDDTHRLNTTAMLDLLLERLPTNGHLLLSGRRRPEVATARLDAAGALTEIVQDDLLLTDDEVVDFANLRGVDAAMLRGAERWPAFVELAAAGSAIRSRRYLEEEALRDLAPERRRHLAAFAFVGGGDDEIAQAVTGQPIDELVGDLPLVRLHQGRAALHDLWAEVLVPELDHDERRRAARAAIGVHRRHQRTDDALDLAVEIDAWDEAELIIGEAIRDGVDGGLRAAAMRRWQARAPLALEGRAVGALLAGLIERDADHTSPRAWALLDQAARSFEASGRRDLELVALLQLGYLARYGGDVDPLADLDGRLNRLAADYPPAAPHVALSAVWQALPQGGPIDVEPLLRIPDDELAPAWRVARDNVVALALTQSGRPDEAIPLVPDDQRHLPVPMPGVVTTRPNVLWASGRPVEALASLPDGLPEGFGLRDRFVSACMKSSMWAMTGQVDRARDVLQIARDTAGDDPNPASSAQIFGVEMLVKIAAGRTDEAAADIAFLLELLPLGSGGESLLRGHLAIPYVLAPSSRPFWDTIEYGPSFRASVAVAAAFVAARERHDAAAIDALDWPEPGFVMTRLPLPWAIEFGLWSARAGRHEAQGLLAHVCEHGGTIARSWIRSWLDDEHLGDAAKEALATTPSPPRHRVDVALLGASQIRVDDLPTTDANWRRERVRELLALLVLRPATSREHVVGVLWPDHAPDKAAKNLRTTLNYLNGVLEPGRAPGDATWFIRTDGQRLLLHESIVTDVWRFRALLDDADAADRAGRPHETLDLLQTAIAMWRGDLCEDLDIDVLDLERIHLRSRFVRASCRAAELLVAGGRAPAAIESVRPALDVDPWHEPSYLALAEAYDAIGDRTSARSVIERGSAMIGIEIVWRGNAPHRR